MSSWFPPGALVFPRLKKMYSSNYPVRAHLSKALAKTWIWSPDTSSKKKDGLCTLLWILYETNTLTFTFVLWTQKPRDMFVGDLKHLITDYGVDLRELVGV